MKRNMMIAVLSAMMILTVLCSCESAFPDDRLDFYWRLDRIEYRDGLNFQGEPCEYKDVDDIMFGFARHIVLIEAPGLELRHGVTTEFGDSIKLDYSVYDNPSLAGQLEKCGLDGVVSTYKLEFPDRRHMVLSGKKTILRFRKW